jgi:hypothetical protein
VFLNFLTFWKFIHMNLGCGHVLYWPLYYSSTCWQLVPTS